MNKLKKLLPTKDKIKEIFNNKNMKIIIPVIVLVVLLIVLFIYLGIRKYNNYRDKKEYSFYQYFAGEKFEYDAIISFNRNKVIKDFEVKSHNIIYDSTPLYINEEENQIVIFPSIMSMIFPLKSQTQYKVPEFSYLKQVNNLNYLTYEDYNKNIDHYIMYDGGNLYLFSDSVSFTLNGEEITLSPLSYIDASYNELKYYNYEEDEFKIVEITEPVIVYNDFYKVNVNYDTVEYSDGSLILTNNFGDFKTIKE